VASRPSAIRALCWGTGVDNDTSMCVTHFAPCEAVVAHDRCSCAQRVCAPPPSVCPLNRPPPPTHTHTLPPCLLNRRAFHVRLALPRSQSQSHPHLHPHTPNHIHIHAPPDWATRRPYESLPSSTATSPRSSCRPDAFLATDIRRLRIQVEDEFGQVAVLASAVCRATFVGSVGAVGGVTAAHSGVAVLGSLTVLAMVGSVHNASVSCTLGDGQASTLVLPHPIPFLVPTCDPGSAPDSSQTCT
jgi:hypothetical protein